MICALETTKAPHLRGLRPIAGAGFGHLPATGDRFTESRTLLLRVAGPADRADNGSEARALPRGYTVLVVIARRWRTWSTAEGADEVQGYLDRTGVRDALRTDGNLGALLLRGPPQDAEVEFVLLTFWSSEAASIYGPGSPHGGRVGDVSYPVQGDPRHPTATTLTRG